MTKFATNESAFCDVLEKISHQKLKKLDRARAVLVGEASLGGRAARQSRYRCRLCGTSTLGSASARPHAPVKR
jgi:hypothetical protein